MKKIKVLFFIYQMGAGGAARTLLNILNNLDRDRFEVVLVTLNYNGSYEKDIRKDVTFIKLDTTRLSRSIFRLAKIIRNQKVHVVFSTIPRVNTIAVLATLFSFTGAKAVVREADNLDGNWLERLKLIGFGLIYRLAFQVISLSEGVKTNLVERYKIKRDDIRVIYNPVDTAHIKKKASEPINKNDQKLFAKDKQTILTIGRLVEQKDQKTLIEAFSRLKKQIDARLVILGEGKLESDLMTLASDLGIGEDVHFVGFKDNPYQYLAAADLFVLTSIHEGFSHVLAEALATGTLIVSTDCKSGPSEVLDKGKYGVLVPVGDVSAIEKAMFECLTLSNERRSDIITDGLKRVETFEAKHIVKQYEEEFMKASAERER